MFDVRLFKPPEKANPLPFKPFMSFMVKQYYDQSPPKATDAINPKPKTALPSALHGKTLKAASRSFTKRPLPSTGFMMRPMNPITTIRKA